MTAIGTELATTGWFVLDQDDVDGHARRTGDDDRVRTDPARLARAGVLGGRTIVQGSLLLARLVRPARVLPRQEGARFALDRGVDRVRSTEDRGGA